MPNNPINKVVFGNDTLIDLSNDTVTADKLLQGYTAHDANGIPIVGTAQGGKRVDLEITISAGVDVSDWSISSSSVTTNLSEISFSDLLYAVQNGQEVNAHINFNCSIPGVAVNIVYSTPAVLLSFYLEEDEMYVINASNFVEIQFAGSIFKFVFAAYSIAASYPSFINPEISVIPQ